MRDTIILHHFPASPFAEKIRLVLGIKGLGWHSVEIPRIMPKPDLMPLTGGYRRTPVMQIGADIYCDTAIIIRTLEARFPSPALVDGQAGLGYALAFWSDRPFFQASLALIFGHAGTSLPEDFRKDRAALFGDFSLEKMQAEAPMMGDRWRAHAALIAAQLEDGRSFLLGACPSLADVHAYMNLWFVNGRLPELAEAAFAEWPKLQSWYGRLAAIGHGRPSALSAAAALDIAKAAEPLAVPARDAQDRRGLAPGTPVTVAAEDYGRDPVEGVLIFSNAYEIAIRRQDLRVGTVAVHFPRAGFTITPL